MSPTTERRQEPRKRLYLNAMVRINTLAPINAVVYDLTAHGCGIAAKAQPRGRGAKVYLRPNGMEAILGTVQWVSTGKFGIAFDAPLYAPVVDHLLRVHSGAP